MNNKINNPKKEVPKGINLNDQDYMTILLSHLKELEKNMAVALTETSNETLYKKYKKMFDNISDAQRKCYELMFYLGWYNLEEAKNTKVENLYNELETQYNDLKDDIC